MKLFKMLAAATCVVLSGFVGLRVSAQEGVTLTPSQITWQTLAYELDANNGMVPGSVDNDTLVDHTFDTYILENEYLKVTLLPEYGGRILSMIYKPTGHEALYQNPVGVPYGMRQGNFYYDWLMVYGGIFPTFPEPEHGKAWLLPWTFEVVEQTIDEVTVVMSITDDIAFEKAPRKFNTGETGLEVSFYVTLKADRAALDTKIVLRNPSDEPITYEYWTCATFAPGSKPGNTRTTAGAEIIAPVDLIKMPPYWPATSAQEEATDTRGVYTFDKLRFFKNWPDMGIAYAYPDMQNAPFSGVINHDNEEGIIRIGNNDVTPGLKIWTWGYKSVEVDEETQNRVEKRPYIELWSGVSREFFTHTTLDANAEVVIEETYVPTVGLTNITHASREALANFYQDADGTVILQAARVSAGSPMQIVISAESQVIKDVTVQANVTSIPIGIPKAAVTLDFKILDEQGGVLLEGTLTTGEAE